MCRFFNKREISGLRAGVDGQCQGGRHQVGGTVARAGRAIKVSEQSYRRLRALVPLLELGFFCGGTSRRKERRREADRARPCCDVDEEIAGDDRTSLIA